VGVDGSQKLLKTLLGSFQVGSWLAVKDNDDTTGSAWTDEYLPSLVDPVAGGAARMAEGEESYLALVIFDYSQQTGMDRPRRW